MKNILKSVALISVAAAVTLAAAGSGNDRTDRSGPGKVRFGVDASEWSSATLPAPGIFPIGGSGQVNGNFVTAERNGVQVAMRAVERFSATPLASGKNGKTAVYFAETGVSDGSGRATWNYDFHVDLRGAYGVAAGKTLADYNLYLVTDISGTNTLFGFPVPLNLTALVPGPVVLLQQSWNPAFGNPGWNSGVVGIYNFTLILEPKTFNGAPLAVDMMVVVENPVP